MTTIRLNHKNNTIEITKAYAKKASTFGSNEYKDLLEAKADYPRYKVVIKEAKRTSPRNNFKGLTYDFMEKYIDAHDEDGARMKRYEEIKALADDLDSSIANYRKIKTWFLAEFPEVSAFYNGEIAVAA